MVNPWDDGCSAEPEETPPSRWALRNSSVPSTFTCSESSAHPTLAWQWTDVEKGATTLKNLALGTTSYSFVQEYMGGRYLQETMQSTDQRPDG